MFGRLTDEDAWLYDCQRNAVACRAGESMLENQLRTECRRVVPIDLARMIPNGPVRPSQLT